MVERIEKIAGIKGIGSGHAFERKEGYEDQAGRQAFAKVLQKAISAKSDIHTTPAAYNLEISSRPTQSLFYGAGLDFSNLTNSLR